MIDALLEINLLLPKIIEHCKPEKVILFGSNATGKSRKNSDIDLLIIKNSGKKRPYRVKEVFEALRGIERNYSLDPLVYTPEEVKRRVSIGDYFIKRILGEGKVLYG